MKLTRIEYPHNLKHAPSVTCFGYFDGLHKGHQGLVNKAIEEAQKRKLKSSLFTFEPNPNFVLGKITKEEMLTTLEDRYLKLKEMGMDEMIIVNFTPTVAKLSCEEFINEFIVKLNIKAVVVGFDFRFGFKGSGDSETLKQLANGRYEVFVIKEIDEDGIKVSSSRIVSLVKNGDVEKAMALLTYPYKVKGKVIKGFGRGKKLTFPTINIKSNGIYILPKRGVYACKVKIGDKEYYGMGNVGIHPTFGPLEEPLLEVHIFNFSQDIYHKKVEISFYKYIREEKEFAGLEELANQLKKDEGAIKAYFSLNQV